MERQEYVQAFASDFVVITRGGKVVRVMANSPIACALFLELGTESTPPGLQFFSYQDTTYDPFELELYVEEFLKKKYPGQRPDWIQEIENLRKGIERAMEQDPNLDGLQVSGDGTISGKGVNLHVEDLLDLQQEDDTEPEA